MRIANTILQDIKFQFRYGFYFIYTIMIVFYIALLEFIPAAWKGTATALVLFTDPAALGFFFIGGILLLEKGERVLDVLFVSPLRIWEYILAKAVSMAMISMAAGLIIAAAALGISNSVTVLILTLLFGSILYTLVGLAVGVKAKSVNQFLIITIPAELILSIPPMLLLFGVESLLLELMPGSLILRLFQWCTGIYLHGNPALMLIGVFVWCIPAFYLASGRMAWFLSRIGGEAYEKDGKAA